MQRLQPFDRKHACAQPGEQRPAANAPKSASTQPFGQPTSFAFKKKRYSLRPR
jgi:hypothetical protein